jgi:hypothetical protein
MINLLHKCWLFITLFTILSSSGFERIFSR